MCLFLNVHHFFFSKAEGPSKCIDNLCVEEEDLDKPKVPEEYFLAADGDYFYVSTIELPWAQAQYDCLARKGHLAELDGKHNPWKSSCVERKAIGQKYTTQEG